MYNLTAITTNGTIEGIFQGVNTGIMGGHLGHLFLIIIGCIAFISFYYSTEHTGKSLAGAGIICFVLGVLLRALNLVSDIAIYISLIVAAAAIAFAWKKV